jgi:hypothetical protein
VASHDAEVTWRSADQLGEGPVWDDRRRLLYRVDPVAGAVFSLDPGIEIDADDCLWVAFWRAARFGGSPLAAACSRKCVCQCDAPPVAASAAPTSLPCSSRPRVAASVPSATPSRSVVRFSRSSSARRV